MQDKVIPIVRNVEVVCSTCKQERITSYPAPSYFLCEMCRSRIFQLNHLLSAVMDDDFDSARSIGQSILDLAID